MLWRGRADEDDAVITVVIFSAINITVCEYRVKSYRRYQERLDAEEEDDDIESNIRQKQTHIFMQ